MTEEITSIRSVQPISPAEKTFNNRTNTGEDQLGSKKRRRSKQEMPVVVSTTYDNEGRMITSVGPMPPKLDVEA